MFYVDLVMYGTGAKCLLQDVCRADEDTEWGEFVEYTNEAFADMTSKQDSGLFLLIAVRLSLGVIS